MINFDSVSLKNWLNENKDFLTNARIQKIQQPTRRDFVFTIRNEGLTKKLYININPEYHHLAFMSKKNEEKRVIEIPQKPPMFCMLLRKYLENSRISKVVQPPYERIIEIYIETFNELSEKIYLCLAVEFMGKHSNMILYNYDTNIILGCAHNVGAEKSREREMAGGLPYVYPSNRPQEWYSSANSFENNEAIDNYYAQCIYDDKFKKLKDKYLQITNRKLKKDLSSYKKMKYKLEKEVNCDKYRLYGDLIMANLYNNKDYSKSITVFNYENNQELTIDLDETKTLKDNANNFYKLYNKGKTSINKLSELIDYLKSDIEYYENIQYSLEVAENFDELNEIGLEIEPENVKKTLKKSPLEPVEADGAKIYIGKNNKQNDYIVSKLSRDEDYWFHIKDNAGSHVLLRCENPTDELIYKCALLAKEYSKSKLSPKAGVIYTKRKFLKKPPGANLGYVIYKNEREIIVP